MKGKGYSVDNPFNASSLAPSSMQPMPNKDELTLAAADVGCKARTYLVKTWYTAETRIQNAQIEKNQLALTALKKKIQTAVAKAAAVTGGSQAAASGEQE
jgi:hypothetical protein